MLGGGGGGHAAQTTRLDSEWLKEVEEEWVSDVGLLGSGVGGDAVGEGGLLMSMLTEHTCASDSDEVFEFAPPPSTSPCTTAIYYTRPADEWRLVAGAQVCVCMP